MKKSNYILNLSLLILGTMGSSPAYSNDYVTWPNGGGSVHKNAKIDPSAYISTSNVGPNVTIEKNVTLLGSHIGINSEKVTLMENSIIQESQLTSGEIRPWARIIHSTLSGTGEVRDHARISGSKLSGPFYIREGARISDSFLNFTSRLEVRDAAVVEKTTLQGGSLYIRENAVVSNSSFKGGKLEIRDDSTVLNSKLLGTVEIRDRSLVIGSEVKDQTIAEDSRVIQVGSGS